MVARFAFAPMTTDLRILTAVMLPLPLVLGAAGALTPAPGRAVLVGSAAFVAVIYLVIWFWSRPTWFEVGDGQLQIVWPLHARTIPLASVERAELVTARELRQRYGFGLRIGAGGLFGGFGRLAFGNVSFAMYVSRSDRFVLVWLREAPPLMITPDEPEAFVAALERG